MNENSYCRYKNVLILGCAIEILWCCVLVVLRGIGQIFLQSNAITGIFFLVAMFYGNPEMTYIMIVAVVISSLTARISRLPTKNVMDGLYGFNAALIGCALIFYFHVNLSVIVALVVGSVASTFFMHLFLHFQLPAYTFPFIGVTWVIKAILEHANLADSRVPGPNIDYKSLDFIRVPAHAFGQVMFQGDSISGILMIVGIFISSPIGALYGVVGSQISIVYTQMYKTDAELAVINAGLFSFNAVLSGIASAGNDVADGLYMLVTVGVATIFYIFLASKNFTTLTFPFVTSMWALAIWKRLILGQLVPKIPKKIEQYLDNNNQKKMMMHHKFNNHANNGDPLNNKLNSSNNNNNNCGNNDLCGVGGDHKSINNEIEIYVELQPIETNTPPPLAVHHHHHHNQQQDKVNNNQTITAKQQQEKEKESSIDNTVNSLTTHQE